MDKKRILVIDDEETSTQMLKTSLERSGAYEVIVVYNGDEGLKKIAEKNPDVVILDVVMPGKDGFEVLKELRKDGVKWRPVIMLTTKSDFEDVKRGYKLEADFYIPKPFKLEVLKRGIETMLSLIPLRNG
jgi:DNA-binding response OmpR family regulator